MDRVYNLKYIVQADAAKKELRELAFQLHNMGDHADYATTKLAALKAELTTVAPQINAAGGAMQGLGQSTGAAFESILKMGAAWVVIQGGTQAIQDFGERANSMRDSIHKLAESAEKLRDSYRELANLEKKVGPDDEVIGETLKAGIAAGMTPDEIRDYREQFLGSSPAGRQKGNIDADTEAKLSLEGAKFGSRIKIAPKTAGDLAGVLSQYGKIGSVEDAASVMGQIEHGLQEGRGNMEPLVRSLIKTAGAVVGEKDSPFSSLGELAAVMGVASTHAGTGREAGTLVKTSAMSLRQFEGGQGAALRNAKITPSDSYVEALRKLSVPIKAAQAQGIPVDQWLQSNGWGNKDEIFGLKQGIEDLDIIDQRVAEAKKISGTTVMSANENFFTRDKLGMERKNRAITKADEFTRGSEAELMESFKKTTAIGMKKRGELSDDSFWMDWASDMGGLKPMLGFQKNRDIRIERQTILDARKTRLQQLAAQGKNRPEDLEADLGLPSIGLKDAGGYNFGDEAVAFSTAENASEGDRRKILNRLINRISTGDGAPGVSAEAESAVTDKLDKLIEETRRTNQILSAGPGAKQIQGMGAGAVAAIAAIPVRGG